MSVEYVTTYEAKRLLGVTAQTVRHRIERGDFPNALRKDNDRWLLPKKDVEAAADAKRARKQ